MFEFDFEMEFLEILATKCVEGRFNYVTVQANLVHTSYSFWLMICIGIKTHDSESRGQEEVGRTRRTSELFTRSTALKFVNALNKPP